MLAERHSISSRGGRNTYSHLHLLFLCPMRALLKS
uniref:Uncharacterized protein n=1 Tax=Anguilla anguilla TaxID=7936 RepID=A0A0E9V9Q2_ANGAN